MIAAPRAVAGCGKEQINWEVGMIVNVRPRTWAGINRPGGQGRVSGVHKDDTTGAVNKVDVKYVLGGSDKNLELDFVDPVTEEKAQVVDSRRSRRRRLPAETNEQQTSDEIATNHKGKVKLTFDSSKHNKKQRTSSNAENEANATQKASKKKQTSKSKSGTMKRKPCVRRKLVQQEPKATSVATATPDVPRSIFVPTAAENSRDLMSELKSTPQPFMLSEAVRRRTTGLAPTNLQESLASSSQLSDRSGPTGANRALSKSCSSYSATPVKNTCRDEEPKSSTKRLLSPKKRSSPANHGTSPIRMATLHSEHDRAMNGASQFIQVVLQGNKSPLPKADEASSKSASVGGPKVDEALLAQFFKALHDLIELNEGIVSDENLADEINQNAVTRQFSEEEVEELLGHLCAENKIMRCDGQIFTI